MAQGIRVTPEQHARIHELKSKHSQREVAAILDIAQSTVAAYWNFPPPAAPPTGVIAFEDKKTGTMDWRKRVQWIRDGQKLKSEESWTQDHATIVLGDGTKPVILGTLCDTHVGAWGTIYELFEQVTDDILKTPDFYVGLLGDYVEFAIKLRGVAEVMGQCLSPMEQEEFLEAWFEEVWHKVAFATWDNHAVERAEKLAGTSHVQRILSKRVPFFKHIGHATVKVGEQEYKLAVSHRFRGASLLNPCHAMMRYMRFEGIDRELCMQGDTHVPGMAKYYDGDMQRVAINGGTLHVNSTFGKRYFSLSTHPAYPVVELWPDKHQMVPYWSLAECLDARRARGE
jgi:hypothetical protein